MTQLTPRQRVQINATLALIHMSGHNPKPVQQAALRDIGRGVSPPKAYDRAVTGFAKGKQELRGQINHTINLLRHSDDATVARYGQALDLYSATDGNQAALDSIEAMFMADSVALAVRQGTISEADAGKADAFDNLIAATISTGPSGADAPPVNAPPFPAKAAAFGNARQAATPSPVAARSGFSGKDANGWSSRSMSQEEKRVAAHYKPAAPGQDQKPADAPIAKQGWTPSNQYG